MVRKQLNVRLPPDVVDALTEFCGAHGVTVNSFIEAQVNALRFAIEREGNSEAFTWGGDLGQAWQKVVLDARLIDTHRRSRNHG